MPELTWTCPQCTLALPRSAAYCRRCGYAFRPLTAPQAAAHPAAAGPTRAYPAAPRPIPPPRSTAWAGPAIAFALCALFACGVLAAVVLWMTVSSRPAAVAAPLAPTLNTRVGTAAPPVLIYRPMPAPTAYPPPRVTVPAYPQRPAYPQPPSYPQPPTSPYPNRVGGYRDPVPAAVPAGPGSSIRRR